MSFSWENEWRLQNLKEESFLTKHIMDKTPGWVRFVRRKVPASLRRTLESAFGKAFFMVFQKGTGIIEKTYKKDEQRHTYKTSSKKLRREGFSAAGVRRFDRQAKRTIVKNSIISLFEGLVLGLGGMGIPDIPVFVSVMLKSIYEIAISFGFDYTSDEEKLFILNIIDTALKSGDELRGKNEKLNRLIDAMSEADDEDMDEHVIKLMISRQVDSSAEALSKELLYGKFIQGKAIIGIIGGMNDVTCLKKITDYAVLKYKRRFLIKYKE
ncbi:MAG: EcsC family protein [Lachnospiraceae bacterium]|nr:EcsC family protein [Lachnospiraceae bacterium]